MRSLTHERPRGAWGRRLVVPAVLAVRLIAALPAGAARGKTFTLVTG